MFKNGVSPSCALTLWMLFAAEEKLSGTVAGSNMVQWWVRGLRGFNQCVNMWPAALPEWAAATEEFCPPPPHDVFMCDWEFASFTGHPHGSPLQPPSPQSAAGARWRGLSWCCKGRPGRSNAETWQLPAAVLLPSCRMEAAASFLRGF